MARDEDMKEKRLDRDVVPKTPPIEMNERNVAEIYCVSEKIIIVEYTAI